MSDDINGAAQCLLEGRHFITHARFYSDHALTSLNLIPSGEAPPYIEFKNRVRRVRDELCALEREFNTYCAIESAIEESK